MDGDNATRALDTVTRLHEAIEGWVAGRLPEPRFEADIADALAPGFRIVEPSGVVVTRAEVVAGLRGAHGSNPEFKIAIERVEVVAQSGPLLAVWYVERQTGAKRAAARNARRSTALIEVREAVRLLHLHETWLES